ncbi:helix-turn-helix domain-containing protein [Thalassospira mesophila]|uniref:Uncharacterized protein n=1 Tax=Thalassospira mesophila TaxID=1293891 RepID=A0A1Y2L174_9PROT|nr:helix-turn-helix transcriptional regulator [Thalassospira mesophila]OSQ38990.1 hypothetical protein TMES_09850 [Thalassospira mesophila]
MAKSAPIAHETVQAVFTAALRRVVGTYQSENKHITLREMAQETGIKQRTLEAYRDGECLPNGVNMLRIMAALPVSFANEVLSLAGFGGVQKLSPSETNLHLIASQAADYLQKHMEHMRDGKLDPHEIAKERDALSGLYNRLGAFLAAAAAPVDLNAARKKRGVAI